MPRTIFALFLCAALLASCGQGTAATTPTPPAPTDAPAAPTAAAAPTEPPAPTEAPTSEPPRPTQQPTPARAEDGPVALRDDISIRPLLETGGGFVRIARDPATGEIYYMDSQANIYRLSVQPGEAASGERVYTHAEIGGAESTTGMAFSPDGTLYVIGNEADETTTRAIIRKGVPDGSGGRTWTTLAETAPYEKSNTQFDHIFNGIAVSPDGQYLFANSGSRTDHGEVQDAGGAFPGAREVPLTSAIFRIPTDRDGQTLPNDLAQLEEQGYLFADGTRNSYDLEFAPNGDLLAGENGPDADYADELNWLQEGHHYGFPWRFGNEDNPQQSPDYDAATDRRLQPDFFAVQNGLYQNDPEFPQPEGLTFTDPIPNLGPDGDQYRDLEGNEQDASDQGQPAYSFTPHRSPLGLAFDAEGALAEPFTGDAFILSWGSAAGSLSDYGRDLLHLELAKSGDRYEMRATRIVRDFQQPIDSVLVGKALYVLDWGGRGTIWEVTLP